MHAQNTSTSVGIYFFFSLLSFSLEEHFTIGLCLFTRSVPFLSTRSFSTSYFSFLFLLLFTSFHFFLSFFSSFVPEDDKKQEGAIRKLRLWPLSYNIKDWKRWTERLSTHKKFKKRKEKIGETRSLDQCRVLHAEVSWMEKSKLPNEEVA